MTDLYLLEIEHKGFKKLIGFLSRIAKLSWKITPFSFEHIRTLEPLPVDIGIATIDKGTVFISLYKTVYMKGEEKSCTIYYFDKQNKFTSINTGNNLGHYKATAAAYGLKRANQSFIVNPSFIVKIGSDNVICFSCEIEHRIEIKDTCSHEFRSITLK